MTRDGWVPVSNVSKRTTNVSTSAPFETSPETATVTWMLLDALAIETAAVPPQDGQELDDDDEEGVNTALNNSVARAL